MKLTKQRNCRHCEPRSGVAIHASNGLDCHGLRPRDDENKTVNASRQNPDRYRTRTLNRVFVTASVARQSMQSRDMDCFTAFAMTGLFMERNEVTRQSVCGIGPDSGGSQ
jgi:hypothetical protein